MYKVLIGEKWKGATTLWKDKETLNTVVIIWVTFPVLSQTLECVGPSWRHLGRKLRICGLAGFPGLLKGFMSLWAHSLCFLFVTQDVSSQLLLWLSAAQDSPPLLMDSNLQGEKPNQQKTKPPNSLWKVAAAVVFYESNRKIIRTEVGIRILGCCYDTSDHMVWGKHVRSWYFTDKCLP